MNPLKAASQTHQRLTVKGPFIRSMKKAALLLLVLSPETLLALEEFGEDIYSSFGDENFVSIATGRKQTLNRAPAVASVITREDIRAMGARDLDEVLETVPGLHVSMQAAAYNPVYVIRGVHSDFNPQVLMLVNGVPITNLFLGNRGQVWGGFPLESVARIEVIRGPGSAIYGADAYAGTINVITKSAEQPSSVDIGISYGSQNEKRTWVNLEKITDSGYQMFASVEYTDTDGADEIIESDYQSGLDAIFSSSASLAPGELQLRRETMDSRLEVKKDLLTLRLGYQQRSNIGTGAGGNQSLDPEGVGDAKKTNIDLTYRDASFSQYLDLQAQLSYYDLETKSDLFLWPPGAFGNTFPDGVIGNPDVYERHSRAEVSGFYSRFENHSIRVGAGYQNLDQYRIQESKNYEIQLLPSGTPIVTPLPGGVTDVSDTTPFNQEKAREIYYMFLQDEWDLAPDWSITAGLRYDHYSDFGETINPRLAIVWQTSYAITSKLLYGRAFRAPSFAELYNINNPVALGNTSLDPELIDTYELAFNYVMSASLTMGLNLFYYEMQDIIRFDPFVAENTGDQTGHGFEFELTWKPLDNLQINGNYAWQSSEDKQTNSTAPNAPGHQFYVRGNLEFSPGWFANLQLNRVMDRERAPTDTRDPVDDYTQIDFVLRATRLIPTWEFATGVKNVTDEDIYEPSLAPGLIPGDLPQAGRNFFAEIRKTF